MKNYINNNLLNKLYAFPTTENSGKLYCSLLVWKAHKYSGKKIDLDNGGIVYLADLITSENIGPVLIYTYL